MRMMMSVFVLRHIMVVFMRMRNGVCMRRSVMCVRNGVCMHVNMVPHERVDYNKHSANYHNCESSKVHPSERFPEEHEW